MLYELRFIVGLFSGTACALYDLKTTDMLDEVGYATVAAGIVLAAYEYLITRSTELLITWITVFSLFLSLSVILYYLGFWGGGDSLMLTAYASLYATGLKEFNPLFMFEFFVASFFVGVFYSLLYSLYITVRSGRVKEVRREIKRVHALLLLPALIVFFIEIPLFLKFCISLLLLSPILITFSRFVERNVFIKEVDVDELKEGDVLAEDLKELGIHARVIRGLSKEEIEKIKKVRKRVKVRSGVPYLPVFPVTLAILYFLPSKLFISFITML
jgi:hypothetical protein